MYGILGEALSDVETLTVLIRRLAQDRSIPVLRKGFRSRGNLLKKGAQFLCSFADRDCQRFVICHDADGPDPGPSRNAIIQRILGPARVKGIACIVVPVQEIEAWILADIKAVNKIFTGWKPEEISNPEGIPSPKERLEGLSGEGKVRPRYNHATHNEKIAGHLDLEKVKAKCPSFQPLVNLVKDGVGNYP